MRWLLIPLVASTAIACRGAGPGPAAPSELSPPLASHAVPTALVLVSGETEAPIAGARLSVGGDELVSDAGGHVVLPAGASEVRIVAAGYLERWTAVSTPLLSLWPSLSPTGLDEAATGRLVYGCGELGCPGGGAPLVRLRHGGATLVPAPELLADAAAMDALEEGARRLSSATRGEVVIDVAPSAPGSGPVVTATIDPADPVIVSLGAGAVTRLHLDGRLEIASAAIAFRSLELARRLPLVLHELGHAFGLGHSARSDDLMWPGPEIYGRSGFSPREVLAVRLMLQRDAGNRFPDDGRGRAAAEAAPRTAVFACVRR